MAFTKISENSSNLIQFLYQLSWKSPHKHYVLKLQINSFFSCFCHFLYSVSYLPLWLQQLNMGQDPKGSGIHLITESCIPKCNWRNKGHQSKSCKALHVKHESIQYKNEYQKFVSCQLHISRPILKWQKLITNY